MDKYKTVKALFIGKDNSLFYKSGYTYKLTIFTPGIIAKIFKYGFTFDILVWNGGHPVCPYTWAGFNKNWRILKNAI